MYARMAVDMYVCSVRVHSRAQVLAQHEWQEFVHFAAFQYTRSLVALDSTFSLMVLCWNKGHATPLHSHAPNVPTYQYTTLIRTIEVELARS